MRDFRSRILRLAALLSTVLLATLLVGCEGDNGADGAAGLNGVPGADGTAGVNCWDLNGNGIGDPEEDLNGDGVVDVFDCNPTASGAYATDQLHVGYFTEHDYLINNFCIAVPTNEGRCTQCHTGYGYADDTFAFNDPKTIDCLVCHDQSGTYAKAPTTAGRPDPTVDLNVVARSVANNSGVPTRANCIGCHAKAGGGDNVKHGDLAMALLDTTRDFDVHMATDGGNFSCVDCHGVKENAEGELVDHGIGGMPYHSTDEGVMKGCVDCHGDTATVHVGLSVEMVTNTHTTLACQVCHIPAFARETSTKTEWYWSDAGQDIDPIPVDPATGRPTYNKKKGTFVWENNVRPELLYYDGKWDRMMINVNDQYTDLPAVLGKPSADYTTAGAMIYPFKKMIGNQQDGAIKTGQTYSGAFEFVDTVMYLTVNHEIAPKEQALGMDRDCGDCHIAGAINWTGLGWTDDPVLGGTRP